MLCRCLLVQSWPTKKVRNLTQTFSRGGRRAATYTRGGLICLSRSWHAVTGARISVVVLLAVAEGDETDDHTLRGRAVSAVLAAVIARLACMFGFK